MEKQRFDLRGFFPEWNACCKTVTVAIICELVVGFHNHFADFLAASVSFPLRLGLWEHS